MTEKLLFITPMFPKDETEDTVLPFITHFSEEFTNATNIQVDILTLMFPISKDYLYNKNKVYTIGSGYKKGLKRIPYLIKASLKGIYLHRKNNYDGILCFWYGQCALIGKIISKTCKIKQIVWMQGQDVKKNNRYLDWIKINNNQIIMLSQQQRDFFYKTKNTYITKIANVAIDKKRFPELNKKRRNIEILGVGNLGLLKNYSLFIDIIQVLKMEFPNIKTIICGGDGENKNSLIKKINNFGLSKNIILKGQISHKEVLDYMNDALVFLHTSKFEGAGVVLQEALYSGCKVVSTIDIEKSSNMSSFYYSLKKEELINKIRCFLKTPKTVERLEKFKMSDTINTIYNAFYK